MRHRLFVLALMLSPTAIYAQRARRGAPVAALTPRASVHGPSRPRVFSCPYPSEFIRREVHAHREALAACYEAEAVHTAVAVGLRWRIEADGRVTSVTVHARQGAVTPAFVECLQGVLSQWRFPAEPRGGTVQVSYPMVFGPTG